MISRFRLFFKSDIYLKYQIFIWPVLSILICLILLLNMILPHIQKIQDNKKTLSEVKEKNRLLLNKAQTLEKINPDTYKENLQAALLALPEGQDIPGILGQILNLISVNSLGLEGINFSPSSAANGISNYQIKIQVSGHKDNVQAFIQNLKENPRILKLSSIDLNGLSQTNSFQSNMELTTYYQQFPPDIGNIEAQISLLSEEDKQYLSDLKSLLKASTQTQTLIPSTPTGKSDPFR